MTENERLEQELAELRKQLDQLEHDRLVKERDRLQQELDNQPTRQNVSQDVLRNQQHANRAASKAGGKLPYPAAGLGPKPKSGWKVATGLVAGVLGLLIVLGFCGAINSDEADTKTTDRKKPPATRITASTHAARPVTDLCGPGYNDLQTREQLTDDLKEIVHPIPVNRVSGVMTTLMGHAGLYSPYPAKINLHTVFYDWNIDDRDVLGWDGVYILAHEVGHALHHHDALPDGVPDFGPDSYNNELMAASFAEWYFTDRDALNCPDIREGINQDFNEYVEGQERSVLSVNRSEVSGLFTGWEGPGDNPIRLDDSGFADLFGDVETETVSETGPTTTQVTIEDVLEDVETPVVSVVEPSTTTTTIRVTTTTTTPVLDIPSVEFPNPNLPSEQWVTVQDSGWFYYYADGYSAMYEGYLPNEDTSPEETCMYLHTHIVGDVGIPPGFPVPDTLDLEDFDDQLSLMVSVWVWDDDVQDTDFSGYYDGTGPVKCLYKPIEYSVEDHTPENITVPATLLWYYHDHQQDVGLYMWKFVESNL